jgi:hypothetical protein
MMGTRMQFPIFPSLRADLGLTAACALVEMFGGRELAVPRRLHARDPLTLLLGVPATAQLIRRYGGKVVRLPEVDWRREAVLRLRSARKTNEAIAAIVGISERQVYRIRAAAASTPAPAHAAAGGGA